jgi:hypothetical protein
VIHVRLTIVHGVFGKTEGAGRLAHIAAVTFEAARKHPDQHSQLRGEYRECMWNELWKVHSFVLARREDLFANVGINAAFQYIDETHLRDRARVPEVQARFTKHSTGGALVSTCTTPLQSPHSVHRSRIGYPAVTTVPRIADLMFAKTSKTHKSIRVTMLQTVPHTGTVLTFGKEHHHLSQRTGQGNVYQRRDPGKWNPQAPAYGRLWI